MSNGGSARVISLVLDTDANSVTKPFGIKTRQHVVFETEATGGAPSGSWGLEKKQLDGTFTSVDLGTEAFTDPAGSATAGPGPNFINLAPGEYRGTFTGSGGVAEGGTMVVSLRDA